MASIRKEIAIAARPEAVWDAVRDFGAVHRRLAPGFVVDTRLDGEARIVTFGNGTVLREVIVDVDDSARRLVWTIVGWIASHHNGSMQVFPEGERGSRLVWLTDVLPHDIAPRLAEVQAAGIAIAKQTLERTTPV